MYSGSVEKACPESYRRIRRACAELRQAGQWRSPPFGGAHALTYTFRSATTVVPSETLQAMPRPGSTCLFECSLTLQRFA
jgi:hypothetical protein